MTRIDAVGVSAITAYAGELLPGSRAVVVSIRAGGSKRSTSELGQPDRDDQQAA
jgi:hypothetical protein